MSDVPEVEALLARIALKDATAFKVLYDVTARQLLAVAMRVLQNRAVAEEVVQEVFVKIWNQSMHCAPGH